MRASAGTCDNAVHVSSGVNKWSTLRLLVHSAPTAKLAKAGMLLGIHPEESAARSSGDKEGE